MLCILYLYIYIYIGLDLPRSSNCAKCLPNLAGFIDEKAEIGYVWSCSANHRFLSFATVTSSCAKKEHGINLHVVLRSPKSA